MYVNVAHFCVDVVFVLLRVVVFLVGFSLWGDWECVVDHNVMDCVFFCYVFLIV